MADKCPAVLYKSREQVSVCTRAREQAKAKYGTTTTTEAAELEE